MSLTKENRALTLARITEVRRATWEGIGKAIDALVVFDQEITDLTLANETARALLTKRDETIASLEVEAADAEVKRNVAEQRVERLATLVGRARAIIEAGTDRGAPGWLEDSLVEVPRADGD